MKRELSRREKIFLVWQLFDDGEKSMQWILVYYISINIIAFMLYGVDKRRAVRGLWRIPEKTLLGIAVFGGALGAFLGMYVFHHKTRHLQFKIGVPCFLIAHALFWIYIV